MCDYIIFYLQYGFKFAFKRPFIVADISSSKRNSRTDYKTIFSSILNPKFLNRCFQLTDRVFDIPALQFDKMFCLIAVIKQIIASAGY